MSDIQVAWTKAQRIKEMMKQFQQWVAEKSFSGARQFLKRPYLKKIFDQQHIDECKRKINYAEAKYKETEKRLYWQWWIIFFIISLICAVAVYKFGAIGIIMEYFGFVASCARFVLGGILALVSGLVSTAFGYLTNKIDLLITSYFG